MTASTRADVSVPSRHGGSEVLAPAGYFRCVPAAIDAGADAVYFGGRLNPHMRSQNQAQNLSDSEILTTVRMCRARGVRSYFTANSPYLADQLEPITTQVARLEAEGLDGVIVTDLGLLQYLARRVPGLPRIASVQVGTMNAWTAALMKDLGVSRVVVERGATLDDAARIKELTGLPVEVFIFGIQCCSHDALCYLGQYFTGTVCRNSCMNRLDVEGMPGGRRRWLFMKYYSGLCGIPDAVRFGIDGVKIEGRSRSSRYVSLVTRTFREAVDAAMAGRFEICESWVRNLSQAALYEEVTNGVFGDFFDRAPHRRWFTNKNRFAYAHELWRILSETGLTGPVISELDLAANIDVLNTVRERFRKSAPGSR